MLTEVGQSETSGLSGRADLKRKELQRRVQTEGEKSCWSSGQYKKAYVFFFEKHFLVETLNASINMKMYILRNFYV